MQYAMRHADARTTIRYDMARANLDRHAAQRRGLPSRHGHRLSRRRHQSSRRLGKRATALPFDHVIGRRD